ncbi:penicillin-binding protein 2 [Candidatus Dojkabacteria bacterium]|nr:penicillin-binding protein 2 [Candidatus Dojkabacteria bacterium]
MTRRVIQMIIHGLQGALKQMYKDIARLLCGKLDPDDKMFHGSKDDIQGVLKNSAPVYRTKKSYKWNFIFLFVIFFGFFLAMLLATANLQLVHGDYYYSRSENNQLQRRKIYPNRGVIFDRNGNKLAENLPSNNIFLIVDAFRRDDGSIDYDKVKMTGDRLEAIVGEPGGEYLSLAHKITDYIDDYAYLEVLLIVEGVDNEIALEVKSKLDQLEGIYLDEWYERNYPLGEPISHVIGYTGKANKNDLEKLEYIDFNDIIGKTGIERYYDKELAGKKGEIAVEVDALGNVVSSASVEVSDMAPGRNLYLTIDSDLQEKAYEYIEKGAQEYGATAGAVIIQDISNGEILALASYPSYDNNDFIGGISAEKYNQLIGDPREVFTARAIAGQQPPGSIFKTIVLASALDNGVIDEQTRYLSSNDFTFSDGAHFYEYARKQYGNINVIGALAVSSNIFPCRVILDWDIYELVPYLENFGIGQKTGIDLPGEESGRLPSPENKIWLAENGFTWLDPIWYPEGDSCNTAIGQGITTVTPIQAVNWVSAIANGGTLYTPHIGRAISDQNGEIELLEYPKIRENFISDDALSVIRRGMREAVAGENGNIVNLRGTEPAVAAKTGTAEYGARNSDGEYEHSHAWVVGFYPYEDPKYAFVFFLEDGGKSYRLTRIVRDFFEYELGGQN